MQWILSNSYLHMQEVRHDEHLWVRWYSEALPDEEYQLRRNQEWLESKKYVGPVVVQLILHTLQQGKGNCQRQNNEADEDSQPG